MALGINNAPLVEALFQSHPNLPDALKTEKTAHEALNRWFDQNATSVAQFYKTSSAALRANPVIEWQVESPPTNAGDLKPVMDLIFRNREGMQ